MPKWTSCWCNKGRTRCPHNPTVLLVLTLLLQLFTATTSTAGFAWTNIQTSITSRDQVDLWTQRSSGCTCPYDVLDHSCACCVSNGCQCGASSPQRCGQCGLEQFCDDMCNITISASEVMAKSGQAYGEIKSPTTLSGPAFCWYRFQAEPGQRVEMQIYRIKRLGRLHTETNRCIGGFLQFNKGSTDLGYRPDQLAICGANERYSPPIVMFEDATEESEAVSAVLLFRVDETTSRSQFLAHYSFTPLNHPDTGVQMKGGTKRTNSDSDCDWKFEESSCQDRTTCQIASPGFPGIYPANTKCTYLVVASSRDVEISVTFTHFNLPTEDCATHYVSLYKGSTTSESPLKSLCGYTSQPETVIFDNGRQLTIEFRSGSVVPPINYNGFVARLDFVAKSGGGDDSGRDRNGKGGGRRKDSSHRTEDGENSSSRSRNKKLPDDSSSDSTKCVQEFKANESRSGMISSSKLNLRNRGCKLIFRGNPGDVLILRLNSYKLRGRSCEAYIRVSVPSSPTAKRRHKEETEEVEHICSPSTRRLHNQEGRYIPRPPLLINSSIVIVEFQANRANVDRLEAAYDFHDVMSEGLPVPESSCDSLYPGRTGYSKGTLQSPGNSHLFRRIEGPLRCAKSLVPTDSQSLTLTINSASGEGSNNNNHKDKSLVGRDRCETFCDGRGCRCLLDDDEPLRLVDHVLVSALDGGRIACFCGDYAHLLPLSVISSSSLTVVYNVADFEARKLGYSASYAFHNEETCGPRRISSPLGSLESPLAASPAQSYHPSSTYFHQQCQWFFDPPPSRQLILKISTAQKMTDCLTWNATIAIWNTSYPDQIGTLIDRFCPEISAKEYILNTTARRIVISLHSLSAGPIHYRISWETRGLLARQGISSNVDTKEVIGGGLGSSSSSSAQCFCTYMLLLPTLLLLHLCRYSQLTTTSR